MNNELERIWQRAWPNQGSVPTFYGATEEKRCPGRDSNLTAYEHTSRQTCLAHRDIGFSDFVHRPDFS
jgi:hypothetical protein